MIVAIRNTIRSFPASILDFIFPPLCVCCQNLLAHGNEHVCPPCWKSLKRVEATLPLFTETRDKLLMSGAIDELVSLYVFEKEGVFQKMIHSVKYSGTRALGVELGRRLGQIIVDHGARADALVPMPLHKRKLRERGYNQCEFIAQGLSGVAGIPVHNEYVRRAKFTQTQTALSIEERRRNMEQAFACVSEEVKEKSIILIDDIITTGATIESCAEVLKRAGARRIIAASVALAE